MWLSEPTAGGQYHWVSVFAPKKWQKVASYTVGWMCALGWQSYVPGAANVCASALQALAVMASDTYVLRPWHIVLLTVLICSSAILFNTIFARRLPIIEAAIFMLCILAFVAFLIVFLALGPHSSAKEVLTHFEDNAGWGSIGTACFVGISGPVITLIGSDSAVHLAEELEDASRQLPRVMLLAATVNYALGFAMLVAFVFVVGNIQSVLATLTGQPYVQVIWSITHSRSSTIAMVALMVFSFAFCAINQNTTSSRQLYAFARDGGLPFSRWICNVSRKRNIPTNAVMLTWFIACGLALVPLGSSVAFVNIQTIGNSGLLVSYMICIVCRIHNRNHGSIYGNLLDPPPFYLGKTLGNIVNVLAICFLIVFLVAGTFPVAPKPTTELVIVAWTTYVLRGKEYLGTAVEDRNESVINVQVESKDSSRA